MPWWNSYHIANNLEDALSWLDNAAGEACILAGGTDLLLDLQQERHPPVELLVDVTRISEMNLLELHGDELFVGAALPLNKLIASPLIKKHAQALLEAGSLIGGLQVRNTATLGGNVAHALPAADGAIALLALDAQVEVASLSSRKHLPLGELYLGPGRSALDPKREIIVGFYMQTQRRDQASAFKRVMRPQGVAIAILNLAVWIERAGETVHDVRIAIGPSGLAPRRALSAEKVLKGKQLDTTSIELARLALLEEISFRTSPHRATQQYRRHMAGILLEETLTTAWRRAEKEE